MNNEQNNEAPEKAVPFNVSEELQKAIDATLTDIRDRSFSGRHPELGRMINCYVCGRRHRGKQCEPHYKLSSIEEEVDTGKQTEVFALAAQNTRKGVFGAKGYAKQRLRPHLNKRKLQFIEHVRQLFGNDVFDPESEEFKEALKRAKILAGRQLKQERIERANVRRHIQDVSRRINRGLLYGGMR